jgi:hypothetical protein
MKSRWEGRALLIAAAVMAIPVGACGDDESGTGGGGTGGAGATGGVGGDGGGGSGIGGFPDVMPCGDPPERQAGECPEVCSGGCANDVCLILCDDDQACNVDIRCPPGIACQVTCTGDGSCRYQIHCDDYYPCNVSCNAPGACTGAEISCGSTAKCDILCGMADSCNGGSIGCGDGECAVQCIGGTGVPTVACGESCMCGDCS